MGQNYGEFVNADTVNVSAPIIVSDVPVALVGPAEAKPPDLKAALKYGGPLVAADGGAETALGIGLTPDAVIGDFDSFDPKGRLPEDRLHRIAEQDSTDFEKCLARISASLVIAAGFLGRRVDHSLAVLSVLAAGGPGTCVLIGDHDVVVHCPADLVLDLDPGTRLSLFPMAEVTGRSEGLEWPIDGIGFAPGGRVGTSNRVTGPVHLVMDGPGMLLILPRSGFTSLLRGLGHG